ncbi:MAG: type II secretion system protein [Methylophilaceae bacterium]|nr:type II secretion system protein [Methylophilaceae bacterium]
MRHSSINSNQNCMSQCRGFTLVELLLVIFLLSSLALVTTLFVDNANEQYRFETTKTRLEQIRRAIIGDSSRTLNGQPEISGFIADMGRLPENLQELVEPPADEEQLWGITDIEVGTVVVGTLNGGWRGSYLEAIQESGVSGVRAYRDGWGNPDVAGDEANFGWVFKLKKSDNTDTTVIAEAVALTLQSLGADGAVGQADANNPYQADYPDDGHKVALNDWAVDLKEQAFHIQLNGTPSSSVNDLKLRLYYLENGQLKNFTSDSFEIDSVSGVVSQPVFPNEKQLLPLGMHAAVVVCNDSPNTVYNGSCPGATQPPYYFKLLPRAYTPPMTVEWTVQ